MVEIDTFPEYLPNQVAYLTKVRYSGGISSTDQEGQTMKQIAIYALAISAVLFGGVEEHGNQGAARESAPVVVRDLA